VPEWQLAMKRSNISKVAIMSDDFSKGKRGAVLESDPNKTRITIRLDGDIVDHFKALVHKAGGGNYQTLMNNALREYIESDKTDLEKKIRKIIREELRKAS